MAVFQGRQNAPVSFIYFFAAFYCYFVLFFFFFVFSFFGDIYAALRLTGR